MDLPTRPDASAHPRLIGFNARVRACRKCHAAGFLDDRESVPIAFDGEPGAPLPRVLLIGQAPGLKGARNARPFEGPSGDRLRDWFEAGGIPRSEFWRTIHFAAVTASPPPPSGHSADPGSTRSSP